MQLWGVILIPILMILAAFVFSQLLRSQAVTARVPSYSDRYRGYYGHAVTATNQIHVLEMLPVLILSMLIAWGSYSLFRDSKFGDNEWLNGHIATKTATPDVIHHHDCVDTEYTHDSKGNITGSYCARYNDWDEPIIRYAATTDFAKFFPQGNLDYGYVDVGKPAPAEWNNIVVGEPVSVLHPYTNILRASGESVLGFNPNSSAAKALEVAKLVPPRPVSLPMATRYKVAQRWLIVGSNPYPDTSKVADNVWSWMSGNLALQGVNGDLGNTKQSNINVIYYTLGGASFPQGVMDAWNGGSKNDVDVFVAIDPTGQKIVSVEVRYGLPGENTVETQRTGDNAKLAIVLRTDLVAFGKAADFVGAATVIRADVDALFNRTPNKQFQYLEPGVHPSDGQITFVYILVFVLDGALLLYFQFADPFQLD